MGRHGRRDRGTHEGSGARRRHEHREKPGEETADGPPRAAKLPPPLTKPPPISNTPERFKPTGGEEEGHGGDENRRLEVEAPSGERAGRPEGEERDAEPGEGEEHAERVGEGLRAHGAAFMPESFATATALIANIGKTQGIRLRMIPPRKAKASMVRDADIRVLNRAPELRSRPAVVRPETPGEAIAVAFSG